MRHFVLLLLLVSTTVVSSQESLFEKPRIVKLLPGLITPLAVKPAIPGDFEALSPGAAPDITSTLFWGNKGVVLGFFQDHSSLREPIIGVQISMNLQQKAGAKGFAGEKELLKEMKSHGYKVVKSRKLNWSQYPVWVVQLQTPKNKALHLAWVGLNAPQGSVLMFQLIYPEVWDQKQVQTIDLWENFLTKTEMLNDQKYFEANGMSLNPGSTLVDDEGAKMQVTAERRNSDHKLLVIVKPMDRYTEFELNEIKVGKIGGQWLRGQLIAKVEGQVTRNINGKRSVIPTHTTTVLIKDVDNYSVNMKEVEVNPRIKVFFQ
jgi:hypothetical protein